MRVLGLDIETTGLEVDEHNITEIAYVLKEIGKPRPIMMETHLIWEDYYKEPSEENVAITGITPELLKEQGVTLEYAVRKLNAALRFEVDYIVAHNGENFDKPFLFKKMKERELGYNKRIYDIPWLDTKNDIDYPFHTKKLKYLAAEYNIHNFHDHMALFDVLTMLAIFEKQDIPRVIERSKSPWITVKALVDYDNRQRAKRKYFMWEACGDKVFPKSWVKRIKECDFEKEKSEADFEIVRIE